MDPVLLPILFDTLDALAENPEGITSSVIAARRLAPLSHRRFQEISRVIESMGLAAREGSQLLPTLALRPFVDAWDKADIERMNHFFRYYQPYDKVLLLMQQEKSLTLPPKNNLEAKQTLGRHLYEKYGVTYVALDTLKGWGVPAGTLYLSNQDAIELFWGGEYPSADLFRQSIDELYLLRPPSDGFMNIGLLADKICRKLLISFARFERLFISMVLTNPGRYITSTSLSRPPSTRTQTQMILPRILVRQSRHGKASTRDIKWIAKRYIEDGIFIGGRNIKMFKVDMEIA